MIEPAELGAFHAMSAVLTGIAAELLCPDDELLRTQYQAARTGDPEAFDRLLRRYREYQGSSVAVISDAILNRSGASVRFTARAIILAWYLGSWYPPAALRVACAPSNDGRVAPSTVLSARAYTSGWVWRIAQAHAMGHVSLMHGPWWVAPSALAVEGAAEGKSA